MTNKKLLQPIVTEILKTNPDTREDDMLLVSAVFDRLYKGLNDMSFRYIIERRKELKLPTFESISRVRRMIQKENPKLASERAVKRREKEEQKYKEEYGRL